MQPRSPDVAVAGDGADDRLEAALERWAERVRANREQVDRFREVPDGADFYAPVTALFRADPDRRDDPQLDALLALTRPDETWLDIGAGAGRFALPLARHVRRVIAVDPSEGMLAALRDSMAEEGVGNIEIRRGRWPAAWHDAERPEPDVRPESDVRPGATGRPEADVALMAHVGYDIDDIGSFLDAMEDAAGRLCVAVLMDRQPSSSADRFWPPIHGEERVSLPGWPEFVEVLRFRGRAPQVDEVTRPRRAFESLEQVETFVRRQLWVEPGGQKDRMLHALAPELTIRGPEGWYLETGDPGVGIVTWVPRGRRDEPAPAGAGSGT